MLGRELHTTLEIEDEERPRLFTLRALNSPVPFRVRHELEPSGAGTRLTRLRRGRRRPAARVRGGDHGAPRREAVQEGLRAAEAAARGGVGSSKRPRGRAARPSSRQMDASPRLAASSAWIRTGSCGRAAGAKCVTAKPERCVSCAQLCADLLDLVAHPARREVVVDDAARLHRGPHRRRADEAEAGGLQLLRELLRLRRLRLPVGRRARLRVAGRRERPHELVQRRARLAQREHAARVRDRRFDLAAVPHDARVAEQPLDATFGEARDRVGVEVRERAAEVLALAQDRQPREARLEPFEAEPLVEAALVRDRTAPLLVVVRDVERVARRPAASA